MCFLFRAAHVSSLCSSSKLGAQTMSVIGRHLRPNTATQRFFCATIIGLVQVNKYRLDNRLRESYEKCRFFILILYKMSDHVVHCVLSLLVLDALFRRWPRRQTREPWTRHGARIVLVDSAGNISIGPAMRDVAKLITDKHAHSIAHTEALHKRANAHANALAIAQGNGAKAHANNVANAAKAHALKRTNEAVAHTNRQITTCVKRNTDYKMTADGHILGIGRQDNWGERYVTWTGSKKTRQSKFKIT